MSFFVDFAPQPGIIRDLTSYTGKNCWWDGSRVRFRDGFPEPIGGWQKRIETPFLGTCRSMREWTGLDGNARVGIGTNLKFYVLHNDALEDITPVRASAGINTDPFALVSGSSIVTVTDTAHGAVPGDFVTYSGAVMSSGYLSAGVINAEHQVLAVIDGNSYTIDVGVLASGTDATDGGASVNAEYQINTGLDSVVFGSGWGAGTWGRGTWGSASSTTVPSAQLRLWSQDNYGEDLIYNIRNGPIYYYDTSAAARGEDLADIGGASDPPEIATEILIAPNQSITFAFGANTIGTSTQDPLLVRWSDYEDYTNWTPDTDSAAGFARLSKGSTFVTAMNAQEQILAWTDSALFAFEFIGGNDIYSNHLVDPNISIIAPNAKAYFNGKAYWMESRSFKVYDGRVSDMPCSVKDIVFNDINLAQRYKIACSTNSLFNEVVWHYPSASSEENDRYVAVNVLDGTWSYGPLDRTARIDAGTSLYPQAASPDGYIYYHEYGLDDGSTMPVSPLNSYLESTPISLSSAELGTGYKIGFVKRVIPDVSFRSSTNATPSLTFILKKKNYSGSELQTDTSMSIVQSATIYEFTEKVSVRMRGRAMVFRVECDVAGVDFRLGTQRFEVQPDGEKS